MENLSDYTEDYNNIPQEDFEGLTPKQMYSLIYGELGQSVIEIREDEEIKDKIPILKEIYAFLEIIERENGVKLTSAGYIPPAAVKELYGEKIIKDYDIECGITKLTKEVDSESIQVTRIISEISGLVRKYKGKLVVTKKGKEYLEEKNKKNWLAIVLNAFGRRFNLGYFDGYKNRKVGQVGFEYSIILLKKYGREENTKEFYARKYFKAFPLIGNLEEDYNISAYASRTFLRFLRYFGFVEIIDENKIESGYRKTDLLDRYIKVNY
jgi:hypothetical protein